MKKNYFNISKLVKIGIPAVFFQTFAASQLFAVGFSLNGSEDLLVSNNISYNYQNAPKTLNIKAGVPIVCSSVTSSDETIVLDAYDPNGVLMNTLNNGILSIIYDFSQNKINVSTDSSVKCATESGLHNDIILKTGFENAANDMQIELFDSNGDPFVELVEIADQQIFSYKYVITNNSSSNVSANIEEFYNLVGTHPYFSGVGGSDWVCTPSNTGLGSQTDCGDAATGNNFVSLQNAVIEAGEQLVVDVSRTVEIPNGTVGENIELLAAVFNKNTIDTVSNNNVAFKTLGTTTNVPPVINFDNIPAFDEDTSSAVIPFTVSDQNMNDADIIVTAQSLNNTIIPDSPSNIIITHDGGGNRSIQVIPLADANTESSSASIRIIADDGITTTTQNVSVVINPVNDTPSFNFACTNNVVDSLTGVVSCNDANAPEAIQIDNFITDINYGNAFDNAVQKTSEYIVNVVSDPDGVIYSDIGGASISIDPVTNQLEFSLVNGAYGTATISVQLRDDGGVVNGGNDLSLEKNFTITVPVPEYKFFANVSNLPSFQGFSIRLESGQQSFAFVQINSDGSYNIGQLVQGSDYTVSIEGESAGALTCVIVGSDNGTIDPQGKILNGSALSQDVNFSIDCSPSP